MDERNGRSPYEDGFYETGATRPPKNHFGLIAAVLAAAFLLVGGLKLISLIPEKEPVKQTGENDGSDFLRSPHQVQQTEPLATDPEETAGLLGEGSLELHQSPVSVPNIPQGEGLSWQEIYENTIDSVVSVIVTLNGGTATGSGVVVSADGYMVTNAHVVDSAVSVSVLLTDGRTLPAKIVGTDTLTDLAVLRAEAEGLTPAEFGDSSVLRVGDAVAAIGDPLGVELRGTMTDGIVSAINRDVTTGGRTMTLIQTNAALNSGNSGGPLLNCYGQVIGINTMKMSNYVSGTSVEGLGFAIPSTTVKEIVDQLIRQGYVSGRPTLGLNGDAVSLFYQRFYRMPAGVYVQALSSGGPAEQAGLQVGDILLVADGVRITSLTELQSVLYNHSQGDEIEIVFYRSGYQMETTLTLGQAK